MKDAFPPLPLANWEQSKKTLHLYFQVVGKIKLSLMPPMNHWWHVTLHLSARGISTQMIPYHDLSFEIEFDFIQHELVITTSRGEISGFKLYDGLSVAAFYKQIMVELNKLGVELKINDHAYENEYKGSFLFCHDYKSYDPVYVAGYWVVLRRIDYIFRKFAGKFCGKSCPVHVYWHHMDLTLTRFSGKKGPPLPENASLVEKYAYSHEVISFGFWPGDDVIRDAAFYSYTYPLPEGLDKEKLEPSSAKWMIYNNSPMAILMYEDLRKEPDPEKALMKFLDTSYCCGATKAKWKLDDFVWGN